MSERRRVDDPQHVRTQYSDASNLDARAALHVRFSTNPHGFFPWVVDRLLAVPHSSILDVGAGPGGVWVNQGKRLAGDELLVLTDLSFGMVSQARGRTHRHCRYAVANAEELPFDDGSFEVVVANHMLYHVPDVDRALAEIARVLVPAGHLFAATNGAGHMRQVGELVNMGQFSIAGFDLDGGATILGRHFSDVSVEEYDDALVVTDAEPVLAYIGSMADFWTGVAPIDELRTQIQDVIHRDGGFRIDKRAGLFTATRA